MSDLLLNHLVNETDLGRVLLPDLTRLVTDYQSPTELLQKKQVVCPHQWHARAHVGLSIAVDESDASTGLVLVMLHEPVHTTTKAAPGTLRAYVNVYTPLLDLLYTMEIPHASHKSMKMGRDRTVYFASGTIDAYTWLHEEKRLEFKCGMRVGPSIGTRQYMPAHLRRYGGGGEGGGGVYHASQSSSTTVEWCRYDTSSEHHMGRCVAPSEEIQVEVLSNYSNACIGSEGALDFMWQYVAAATSLYKISVHGNTKKAEHELTRGKYDYKSITRFLLQGQEQKEPASSSKKCHIRTCLGSRMSSGEQVIFQGERRTPVLSAYVLPPEKPFLSTSAGEGLVVVVGGAQRVGIASKDDSHKLIDLAYSSLGYLYVLSEDCILHYA